MDSFGWSSDGKVYCGSCCEKHNVSDSLIPTKQMLVPTVTCKICHAEHHVVCVKWITSSKLEYICESCQLKMEEYYINKAFPVEFTTNIIYDDNRELFLQLKQQRIFSNPFHIKTCLMSDRIQRELKSKFPNFDLHCRVTSFTCQSFECDSNTISYDSRCIMLFQRINEGKDFICVFAMYLQEYGPECGYAPNNNRIYMSYMDSVKLDTLKLTENGRYVSYTTRVFYTLLKTYLEYQSLSGFQFFHIWACPPKSFEAVGEQKDFIFNCHPESQKNPDEKRLIDWYRKFVDFCGQDIINPIESMRSITKNDPPYFFEGDLIASHYINHQPLRDSCSLMKELDPRLMDNLFVYELSMSGDVPFVIEEPYFNGGMANFRENFLIECQENRWEFSDQRFTIWSTANLVHDVLNKQNSFDCDACKSRISFMSAHWRCESEDVDYCQSCWEKKISSPSSPPPQEFMKHEPLFHQSSINGDVLPDSEMMTIIQTYEQQYQMYKNNPDEYDKKILKDIFDNIHRGELPRSRYQVT